MRKLAVLLMGIFTYAYAQEAVELGEIELKAKRILLPTKQTGETVYTGVEVTQRGLNLFGEKGRLNVYQVLSIVPGVIFHSADPHNLASEQANVRIRGLRGTLGVLTVEGVPNYGVNPIGPRTYIYDLENFESVAIYKGAIPADLGAGIGNRAGVIELKPLWAKEEFGLSFSQTFGSFNYARSFLRLDTGSLPTLRTRMSLSYSYSKADKWKGPGELGPRHNINFTLVQPIGDIAELKVFANYNEIKHHKYRSLTYDETKLPNYRRIDFNKSLTGIPAQDYLYYDYNREKHINKDLSAYLTIKPFSYLSFTLKPYYSKEDAKIREGVLQGFRVQERTRDIERGGLLAETLIDLKQYKVSLGYHYEEADFNIYTENYNINSGTGTLRYAGFGVYTKSIGKSLIHSPYFKVALNIDKFNLQAGIKHFKYRAPKSEGYVWNSAASRLQRAPDADRDARTYDITLPTFGVSYFFSDSLEAYFSYGRTFVRPYAFLPLINTYITYRDRFRNAGVTLDDLFKGFDIERSDNFDLGLRFNSSVLEIAPTLFYSRHKKLLTTVYDPRVNLNYQQNIGKATGYGVELPIYLTPTPWITFFAQVTYHRLTYDMDITFQGNTLKTKGKQVVDVPRWSGMGGAIIKYQNFEIIPQVKYVGKRYGDAQNREEVSSYTVIDLKISYTKGNLLSLKNFKAFLEFDNLFDKKYIAVINAQDDAVQGTSYLVGAPFTVRAGISFSF